MNARILNRTLLAATAAALLMSSAVATAQPGGSEAQARGSHGPWMLKRYDADGDGTISLQEFQAAGDAMFTKLDIDGDGRLSAEELTAARPERARQGKGRGDDSRPNRMLARMDADGDGYVSRAEFDAARMTRFNALDVNGNSVIDADELPARKGGWHRHGKRECARAGGAAL